MKIRCFARNLKIALCFVAIPVTVHAQVKTNSETQVFGGIVVDDTVSAFGHAFFRYFVTYWRDNGLSERYVLSVHERVSARRGSEVWVAYAQRRIFQATLPPSDYVIRGVGEKAAEQVSETIVNIDVQRLLMRDHDMAADEID